tara:strand:- start:2068 stop:2388 length:321 start_codon:yes stop_codon:yes gene_type:complete
MRNCEFSIIVKDMNNISFDTSHEDSNSKRDRWIVYACLCDKDGKTLNEITETARSFGELYKNDLSYLQNVPICVLEKAFKMNICEEVSHIKCIHGNSNESMYTLQK